MTTIPKAVHAHAKKHGMTIAKDARRAHVGIYRKGGRDIVSFNLSDAKTNPGELFAQIDEQIARTKKGKGS